MQTTRVKLTVQIGFLFAIYLACVFALQAKYFTARIDLTQNRLFTLSQGSRHILSEIKTPIELTLFYSEKEARPYPQFRQYADRVHEKIQEYVNQSNQKIRFTLVDPEPYSSAEDLAIGAGITAIPLEDGSGPLYFGVIAKSEKNKQSIEFIKPELEQNLEYELSKLIQNVQKNSKPNVVLISDLAVSGSTNAEFGTPSRSWVAYRQLSERYQLMHLSSQNLTIPDNADVLWIMQPNQWPPESIRKIQQYIEKGGHAVIVLDPQVESVNAFSYQFQHTISASSSTPFNDLMLRWGIGFDESQVVLDSKNAWLMQLDENQFPKRNPALISLPAAAMNQRDRVTADLDRVVLSTSGALTSLENSPLRISPLLQSSDSSKIISIEEFQRNSEDPEQLLNRFESSQEPFVLAARFTGKLLAAQAAPTANFIVIADTDFLSDRLWVIENNLFGQPVYSAQASNGDFFFNVIDQLSGSDDLISIRSRGMVSRPFDKVDQIRRIAEQNYRNNQEQVIQKLDGIQQKINAMQTNSQISQEMAESVPYQQLISEKLALRRQLRQIQRGLNQDVERLGKFIKVLNIFAIPLLLLLISWIISMRSRKPKEYIRKYIDAH